MLYQILVYALDHDPEVYDRTAETEASAIADAIECYGMDTGLPDDAIEVKVIGKFNEQAAPLETHDVVTVALGPLRPHLDRFASARGLSRAQGVYELVWRSLARIGYKLP